MAPVVSRGEQGVGGSYPTVYYNLVMNQDRSSQYAHGIVTTSSAETTKRLLDPAQLLLDNRHPAAQILVRRPAQGPPVVAEIEYRLFGPNRARLQELGDTLRNALQAHPDVLHTQATIPRGEPKLYFHADEDATRLAGMTLADVAGQLESGLEGSALGSIIEDLEQLPVRVRYSDRTRGSMEAIASSPLVQPGSDRWTSAASLGKFDLRPALGGITRFDGERTNVIKAYVRTVKSTTRHVLATTLTTIGGFLPLLLFVGGDFWPSLSIVWVGGIGGTTIIALLYIPAAYVLIQRPGRAASSGMVTIAGGGISP